MTRLALLIEDTAAADRTIDMSLVLRSKLLDGSVAIETTHCNRLRTAEARQWVASSTTTIIGRSHALRCGVSSELLEATKTGQVLAEPVPFALEVSYGGCPNCTARVRWTFDGITLRSTGAPCPHPDGLPAYSAVINCPSGKLVFGNDFRDLYAPDLPEGEDGRLRENGAIHSKRVFDTYAKVGMGHGYVGNTCPGVWQHSSTEVGIWCSGVDEPSGTNIGGICTDLWWYSVVDGDDYVAHGGQLPEAGRLCLECVAHVEPGCYLLTHKWHTHDDRDDKSQDYATLKRIEHTLFAPSVEVAERMLAGSLS